MVPKQFQATLCQFFQFIPHRSPPHASLDSSNLSPIHPIQYNPMTPSKVRQIIIPITPQLDVLPDRLPSDRLGSSTNIRVTLKQMWSSSHRSQLTILKGGRGFVSVEMLIIGMSSSRVGPRKKAIRKPLAVGLRGMRMWLTLLTSSIPTVENGSSLVTIMTKSSKRVTPGHQRSFSEEIIVGASG